MIGSGMSTGVSLQAKPNIRPWSPAPCESYGSSSPPARFSYAVVTPCPMSGLCLSSATDTPQVSASKPKRESVYPMCVMVSRTMPGMSMLAVVVTSPAIIT